MDSNQPPYQNQPNDNPQPKNNNPLAVMQPGEQMICEVRRHPIGLIGIYLTSAIVVGIALAAAALVPTFLPDTSQQTKLGLILGALLVAAVALLYTYVANFIYTANRWIVTSDSLTQISQAGLFNKQISQLSLANLEDVTVDQNGILQAVFNFGSLRAETAGQRGKFVFPFCPDPNEYARKLIQAHEEFIAEHPEGTVTANRPLATVQNFNQPPGPTQA